MITAYAVYAMVLSLVIGMVAVLGERAALLRRWPVRWVWLGAMGAMVLMPLGTLLTAQRSAPAPEVVAKQVFDVRAVPDSDGIAEPDAQGSGTTSPSISISARWERGLTRIAERTAIADRALVLAWALLTGALAWISWRGVRRLQDIPRSLEQRVVQGTAVYVSDSVGPAAIGGAASAIVIPQWVLELDRALLALVLRHEREHVQARDPRVLAVGLSLLVLVPWLAPLWWAWRRLRLAIELDCDARVLRAEGNAKLYAKLLLFMSQQRRPSTRRIDARWSLGDALSLPLLLAFNPHLHQLTQRINAMTARPSKHPARLIGIAVASAAMTSLALAIPAPTVHFAAPATRTANARAVTASRAEPVIVKVTHLGIELAQAPTAGSAPMEIVIYGVGPVRVGLGTASPTALRDTIRLDHLPAFTADVSYGEVHVEMRRVAGTLELGGNVTGGAMSSFTIRARHVVLSTRAVGVGANGSPFAPPPSRWDSLTARRTSLELERVRLLVTYEPRFARVQAVERELGVLDDLLYTMPAVAAWNAIRTTTQALTARMETLLGERARLDDGGKRATREFAAIEVERDLLRRRMTDLRRKQAQWGPLAKPYAVRTPVSEAQTVMADSVRTPPSRDSLDRRLVALDSALNTVGAPASSHATVARLREMNQVGLTDSSRATVQRRLDQMQPVFLADSLQRMRRRLDSMTRAPAQPLRRP